MPCGLTWDAVVYGFLLRNVPWLCCINHRKVYRTPGPALGSSLELLADSRNIASLSLSFNYSFG